MAALGIALSFPLAHAGHWLAQLAYLAPLLVIAGVMVVSKLREKRGKQD